MALPTRTTFHLGPVSRSVLDRPGKTSRRLEWVCAVYAQATRSALPRLRREEWLWLADVLADLDVRSVDHLALMADRVRNTPGGASGVDHLGVAARLSSLPLIGRASVWEWVSEVRERRATEPGNQTVDALLALLPAEAFLR